MKILGIGESVIDTTYLFDKGISQREQATLTPQMHVGGPVLVSMILLARLGVSCTYISTIGRDSEANSIKSILHHEKVRLLPKYQNHTKVNTILVDTQTGFRKKIRGDVVHQPLHGLDKKFLQQFDAIIIDRHESVAFYELLGKKATHTKIIIDPSIEVSNFTRDMIRYADYPIVPIELVAKLSTNLNHGLQTLHAMCQKPVIVTMGEHGSIVYDGNQATHIPAKRVAAVDVTGAGDIYRGGFAYGVTQGWDTLAAASFASLVAGLQCTKLGNAAAIPTNAEILLQTCNDHQKQTDLQPMEHYFQSLL